MADIELEQLRRANEVYRQRFNRTVRVENTLINIYAGKEPIPTEREWFFQLAKQLGIPEDHQV